jgi:trimeric autotransporter adhesin
MQISSSLSAGLSVVKATSAKTTAVDSGTSASSTDSTTTDSTSTADSTESEKAQKLLAALAKLKQLRTSQNAAARSGAESKVARLKELLKNLKMFGSGDPKRMAKMIAQIAKELDAANKDYIRAGGSSGLVSSSDLGSATSETTDATADTAQDNSQETETVSSSDGTDTTAADGSQATQTDSTAVTDEPSASSSCGTDATATDSSQTTDTDATSSSDSTQSQTSGSTASGQDGFFDEVRKLKQQLVDMLKQVEADLKKRHMTDDTDTSDAQKALDEIDRDLKSATQSSSTATDVSTGSLVNISA